MIFIAARRARQFYRMRGITLCDICEGSDCSESCQIRALGQRAADQQTENIFAQTKTLEEFAKAQSSSILLKSPFILVVAIFLQILLG